MPTIDALTSLFKIPSPLEKNAFLSKKYGLNFWVKRDDLIHPVVSGNKWRKLKYYFESFAHEGVVTAGGYYSNHLHATAFACQAMGIPCTGVVRGLAVQSLNKTLQDCVDWGMRLEFLPRDEFDTVQNDPKLFDPEYADWLSIPIGGEGELGTLGCHDIVNEIAQEIDYLICPVGTGTTIAGIIQAVDSKVKVMGISPFNVEPDELRNKVGQTTQSQEFSIVKHGTKAAFGKMNSTLFSAIIALQKSTGLPLDPIYNGKALLTVIQLLDQGVFQPDTNILYLNTGGMQGWTGIDRIDKFRKQ